jgi:hypothetical protein
MTARRSPIVLVERAGVVQKNLVRGAMFSPFWSGFFTGIGLIVSALFVLLAIAVICVIAGNIYGGIRGAYRLRAILARKGEKPITHWPTIRLGLRAWGGQRYREGRGTSWRVHGLTIPVDGRDPIPGERFYGA